MIELTQRSASTHLHNTISNLVGQLLLDRPNEQLRISDVHELVSAIHGDRYTQGQVRKGLEWQAINNPDVIKTKLSAYKKTRLYWYEPSNNI